MKLANPDSKDRLSKLKELGEVLADIMRKSMPAVSIWFEIWGVADPGKNNLISPGKFPKNSDFFRQFHQKFDIPDENWPCIYC